MPARLLEINKVGKWWQIRPISTGYRAALISWHHETESNRSTSMQDVIGIALLVGVAFLLKLWFHSTVLLHVTVRVIPFNVVAFWILLATSAVWFVLAGSAYILRIHR
jgi:uncharacterized membrane protein